MTESTQPRLKILAYGKPGTGKTRFVVTLPQPILMFDFDKGKRTIESYEKASKTKLDITYLEYDKTSPKAAQQMADDLHVAIIEAKYASIVADSLTSLTDLIMTWILSINTAGGEKKGFAGAPAMLHYMGQMTKFTETMNKFFQYPGIVYMTAHEDLDKDEALGTILIRPSVTGKLASRLPKDFDEYYHAFYDSKHQKWMFNTRPSGLYEGRTRLDLPEVIEQNFNIIKEAM